MTAHILVTGVLFRDPQSRTSKAGKPFVTATIRSREGDGSQFWRVTCFSESAGEDLMRLSDRDALSAAGAFKQEQWQAQDGTIKHGLAVIADRILPLKPEPRAKKPKAERPAPLPDNRPRQERTRGVADSSLDDDIPF
jgi:single-stranded DNA-binding protein